MIAKPSENSKTLAKEAREWVASQEGQTQIREALREAKEVTSRINGQQIATQSPIAARATYPLPPCLNEQISSARTHWSKSASTKKKWTNAIAFLSKDLPKFPGKVWIELFYSVKTFARDADNISASRKFLMDGLVQAGVIQNDNLMVVQSPIIEWFERGKVDEVTIVISDRPIVEICKRHSGISQNER